MSRARWAVIATAIIVAALTVLARAQVVSTTIDLSGAWTFNGQATSIAQSGTTLTFTNETGQTSAGSWTDATHVVATDWGNLAGTFSDDRQTQTLAWANGTSWTRADAGFQPIGKLQFLCFDPRTGGPDNDLGWVLQRYSDGCVWEPGAKAWQPLSANWPPGTLLAMSPVTGGNGTGRFASQYRGTLFVTPDIAAQIGSPSDGYCAHVFDAGSGEHLATVDWVPRLQP